MHCPAHCNGILKNQLPFALFVSCLLRYLGTIFSGQLAIGVESIKSQFYSPETGVLKWFDIPNGGELYEYPCGFAETSAINNKTNNTFIFEKFLFSGSLFFFFLFVIHAFVITHKSTHGSTHSQNNMYNCVPTSVDMMV